MIYNVLWDKDLYPPNLIRDGATLDMGILQYLYDNFGIRAYPMDESAGAVFSGDGLPDGVISGTPTTYRAATNVPKSPQGLEIDHNALLAVDGAIPTTGSFDVSFLLSYDGGLTSAGAYSQYITLLWETNDRFYVRLNVATGQFTASVAYSTSAATHFSGTYAIRPRKISLIRAVHNATTKTLTLSIDGVKMGGTITAGVGTQTTLGTTTVLFSQNTLRFLDGVGSLVGIREDAALTDKQIFDIPVELGLAQYGSDLFDPGAGTFDTGTGTWTAYGANTLANVGNELEVTYVDNALGAFAYLKATGELSTDLDTNSWYLLEGYARVNGGSVHITLADSNSSQVQTITSTDRVKFSFVFLADVPSNTYLRFNNLSAGEKVYLSDLTIKKLDPTPTIDLPYGPDLFDNGAGTFTSGTYAWAAFGTNAIANVSNALEITGDGSNAAGAYNYFSAAGDLSVNLQTGDVYRLDAYMWVSAGATGIKLRIYDGNGLNVESSIITSTTPVKVSLTFTKDASATQMCFDGVGAGEKVYITNMTLREVL